MNCPLVILKVLLIPYSILGLNAFLKLRQMFRNNDAQKPQVSKESSPTEDLGSSARRATSNSARP